MAKPQTRLVDHLDRLFYHLAGWAVSHRAIIVLLSLGMLAGGVYFASKVQSDNSLAAYFDTSDPTYVAYIDYLQEFQSDEVTYILYRVPDRPHGPFNLQAMRQIAGLTSALQNEVPFARKVTSLTNVELIRADGDSIYIDDLMAEFPPSQEAMLEVRELVLSRPLYVNYLVNPHASYAAIIIDMARSSVDELEAIIHDPEKGSGIDNLYPQVSDDKVREILSRPEYAGIEFFLSGDVPMNSAYNNVFLEDTMIGTVLTLGLLALLSLLLFRTSLLGLLGPLVVVVLSIVMVLAMMGAFGWVLGLFFGIVPTLLCAVGVAQSVHIILEFQREYALTGDRPLSVRKAISKVGGACMLSALTTALGFLVMTVSHLKVLSEMAMYAAAGVMFTFVLSVTLLVTFLSGGSRQSSRVTPGKDAVISPIPRLIERLIALNLRWPSRLVGAGLLLWLVALAGITQLKVDFNFLEEFKPHVEWRQHTERVEEVMGGILNVSYIVDTGRADGVKDPALIQAIDKLQSHVQTLPFVKKSYSVADIQKDINRSFHADEPSWYRVSDSADLIAQYFLVYELSGGEELRNFVSSDYHQTVVEIRVEMTGSRNVESLIAEIDRYLVNNPIPGAEVRKSGIGLMWVKIGDYIAQTQMVGYSLIFVGVALVLCIAFGSIKVGLLAMIPNLMPVIVVLGVMGWTQQPLDYMKLLLATIAIGIAVDDTIHLVMRFRRRFFETGNYRAALEKSMTDVGPALVVTTVILVGAFSCYLLSNMQVIASFGVLLSLAIVTALLADLIFMPALLLLTKPFGPEFEPAHVTKPQIVGEVGAS